MTSSSSSIINIVLPIEMADTSYLVLRQMEFTSGSNSYAAYNNGIWVASGYPKTTTSFYIQQEGTAYGPAFNWEVKGMAAA